MVPSPGSGDLSGVVAIYPTDAWAVGNSYNTSCYEQTLTEHWDGASWSVISSQNPGSQYDYLQAVAACASTATNDTSCTIWTAGCAVGITPANVPEASVTEAIQANLVAPQAQLAPQTAFQIDEIAVLPPTRPLHDAIELSQFAAAE